MIIELRILIICEFRTQNGVLHSVEFCILHAYCRRDDVVYNNIIINLIVRSIRVGAIHDGRGTLHRIEQLGVQEKKKIN